MYNYCCRHDGSCSFLTRIHKDGGGDKVCHVSHQVTKDTIVRITVK